MQELARYSPLPEMVSMERNRDLRDYALVHGFHHAKDFVESLGKQLTKGSRALDMGCGLGKAISQAGRELLPAGIQCLALDLKLPEKQYKFVHYVPGTFSQTGLEENSLNLVFSVCGLLYYAENENDLRDHIKEARRILSPTGTLSTVVDPVIYKNSFAERTLAQLTTQEIRIQSPTVDRKSFKINVCKLLQEEGLVVDKRILPKGGKMIDDEITLSIKKI